MFSETTATTDAYIGGEIVNPLADEIVLSKNSLPIDTLKLDNNNQFHYYFENVQPGLYSFSHGSENQLLYLEPGDSTMIFVNTMDFDQSLNFSGRGAEKNNFLIDMFLLNEKNNDLILSYSRLNLKKFEKTTDSIRRERNVQLKNLQKKNNFSEGFLQLAKTSVDYEYYDLKERYTYLMNRYYPHLTKEIPKEFHDYRKEIDFHSKELENYYGYLRLIDNYLKNKAMESCTDPDNSACREPYNYTNIRNRIAIIDTLTTNPNIKNLYFSRLGIQGIICSKNEEQLNSILKVLDEEEISEEKRKVFQLIAAIQKVYIPGSKLPKIKFTNAETEEENPLINIIEKPTIFYNWSVYSPAHHQQVHENIMVLKQKYPEINFIGLNIDAGEKEIWQKTIVNYFYDATTEYQLQELNIDKKYLQYFLNKLLFVDEEGNIINGNIKMISNDLEIQIQEYLNSDKKAKLLAGA